MENFRFMHDLVSLAGQIDLLTGQEQFPPPTRWELHDAINRLAQTGGQPADLPVVVAARNVSRFGVEVSLNGDLSQTSRDAWLVAVSRAFDWERFTYHPWPAYWRDGFGEHLEVFALADSQLYLYRRSQTWRAHYALRVLALDFPDDDREGQVWGVLADPTRFERECWMPDPDPDIQLLREEDRAAVVEWVRSLSLGLPPCPQSRSEEYALIDQAGHPDWWRVHIEVDEGALMERICAVKAYIASYLAEASA